MGSCRRPQTARLAVVLGHTRRVVRFRHNTLMTCAAMAGTGSAATHVDGNSSVRYHRRCHRRSPFRSRRSSRLHLRATQVIQFLLRFLIQTHTVPLPQRQEEEEEE